LQPATDSRGWRGDKIMAPIGKAFADAMVKL